MLENLAWVSLEALDGKGRVVGVLMNDAAADDLEELAIIPDKVSGQVTQLLGLMLRAQDVALKRQETHTRQLNDTVLKLAEVLMSRLVSLENSYARNLKLVEEFAKHASADDGEGDGLMSGEAIQAVLPLLLGKVLAPPTGGSSHPKSPTPPAGGASVK